MTGIAVGLGTFVPKNPALAGRILICFFATIIAVELFGRANLADQIPVVFTFLGAVLGTLFGALLSARLHEKPDERYVRQALVVFAIPLLCLFAGTYTARSIFLEVAFIGIDATPVQAKVMVVSRATRGGGLRRKRVNVVLEPGSREFRILVSEGLYSLIGPRPLSGTHCLKLMVETGRWGYRRVAAPNYFDEPLGFGVYEKC